MEAVAVLGGAGVRRNLAGLVPVAYSPPLPFGPAYAGLAGEELLWGCDGGRGAARGGAGWVSGGPRLATSRGGAAGSVGPAGGSPHWPLAAVSKAIFPVTLLPLALGAVAAGVWLGGRCGCVLPSGGGAQGDVTCRLSLGRLFWGGFEPSSPGGSPAAGGGRRHNQEQ